jgi:hypothetical protein
VAKFIMLTMDNKLIGEFVCSNKDSLHQARKIRNKLKLPCRIKIYKVLRIKVLGTETGKN